MLKFSNQCLNIFYFNQNNKERNFSVDTYYKPRKTPFYCIPTFFCFLSFSDIVAHLGSLTLSRGVVVVVKVVIFVDSRIEWYVLSANKIQYAYYDQLHIIEYYILYC